LPAELALLALLLAAYALMAGRLTRLSIGPAMAFVAIGFLVSEEIAGLVSLEPGTETVRLMAEAALTLLLFVDASGVKGRALRRDLGAVVRLLVVGLLLTIALGALGASLLFPGISFGMALLIASALAPTDAALGQPVVSNPSVPARVRRLLNVESGLNDGIATPFVLLALALATAEATGHAGWIQDALAATLIGVVVGVGLGLVGGRLLIVATRRGWNATGSQPVRAGPRGCLLSRFTGPWRQRLYRRVRWRAGVRRRCRR